MIREFNGVSIPVARRVESVFFRRTGKILKFELEVNASEDKKVTSTLNTFLRNLK